MNNSKLLMGVLILVSSILNVSPVFPDKKNTNSASFEDSIKVGKDVFTIKVRKTFVTLGSEPGEKIEFSVYRNGKYLFPVDSNYSNGFFKGYETNYRGGTLIGCRQPFTLPQERNPIEKMNIAEHPKG